MKSTGIVRKVEELGRVVIPKVMEYKGRIICTECIKEMEANIDQAEDLF